MNRPRKDKEPRNVYSVRLPADIVKQVKARSVSLTDAIIEALLAWLKGPSK